MKSSYAALAVVGIALVGLWYAGGGTATLPPSASASELLRVSEPLTHDNLTVYFVHGSDAVADVKVATLQEALEAGWAVVHETGEVNQLAVENRSTDTELFIQEGDIIKGGRQDRLIAIDMLLPPNSGRVPFPAHCVEQGRWTGRGGEDATRFKKSDNFVVGNGIKYANATYQQGEVWKNVKENQDKLSRSIGTKVNAAESESSLQLALENKAVQTKVAEYEKALKKAGESGRNVVGVVFVVNGKMTGAEVYGSSVLFQKAWPKLLSSAAAEALAEKTDKPHATAPSAQEVERFLACGGEQQAVPGPNVGLSDTPNGTSNEWRPSFRMRNGIPIEQIVEGMERSAGGLDAQYAAPRQANLAPNAAFSGRSGSTRTVTVSSSEAQPNRPLPAAGQYDISGTGLQSSVEGALGGAIGGALGEGRQGGALGGANALGGRITEPGQAIQPPGNRLNVNRVDGAGGLVTESRDPARQNAIIHKSYIKK